MSEEHNLDGIGQRVKGGVMVLAGFSGFDLLSITGRTQVFFA